MPPSGSVTFLRSWRSEAIRTKVWRSRADRRQNPNRGASGCSPLWSLTVRAIGPSYTTIQHHGAFDVEQAPRDSGRGLSGPEEVTSIIGLCSFLMEPWMPLLTFHAGALGKLLPPSKSPARPSLNQKPGSAPLLDCLAVVFSDCNFGGAYSLHHMNVMMKSVVQSCRSSSKKHGCQKFNS